MPSLALLSEEPEVAAPARMAVKLHPTTLAPTVGAKVGAVGAATVAAVAAAVVLAAAPQSWAQVWVWPP